MKLKGFYINGYKCLKHFFLPFTEKLVVLVGPNDSGKTAILEAINYFYKGIRDGRRIRAMESGKFYMKSVDEIEIAAVFEDDMKKINCALTLVINSEESPASCEDYRDIVKVSVRKENKIFDEKNIRLKDGECSLSPNDIIQEFLPELIFLTSDRNLKEAYGATSNIVRPVINEVIGRNHHKRSLKALKEDIDSSLEDKLRKISETFNNVYGLNGRLYPSTRLDIGRALDWEFYVEERSMRIPLREKGAGVQNIVYLNILRLTAEREESRKYFLIIDEIENHLYPYLIHRLLDIIEEISRKNYYVLIVTHSPIIINNVDPKCINLIKKEKTKSKIYPIRKEEELIRVNEELEVKLSDILGAQTIVLVEGKNDQKFIQNLLKMSKAHRSFQVISMNGAQNASYYVNVYINIVLRFLGGKILLILDGDDEGKREYKKILNNNRSYIDDKKLHLYIFPSRVTMEDMLDRKLVIPIVKQIVEDILRRKNYDYCGIYSVLTSLEEELSEEDQPLLHTIGRILGKMQDIDYRLIRMIKDQVKEAIWRKIKIKEDVLSKQGRDLYNYIKQRV